MIICGDCLAEMAKMDANSIDAVICDPPYGLEFMGKDWDSFGRNSPPSFKHSMQNNFKGFKPLPRPGGLKYDGMIALQEFCYAWAVEALRVAKPGAFLLAFGGTRTFHRLVCAIEDAGWEIRDCLGYLYGSGFPKSHRPSLDYEHALCEKKGDKWFYKSDSESMRQQPPFRSDEANEHDYLGTALKPAWEPIIMARKPLDGTVAANVLKWGTGAINVDGCRVEVDPAHDDMLREVVRKPRESQTWEQGSGFKNEANHRTGVPSKGRWPANLLHDGSDEVLELFPQTGPGMFPPKRGDGQVFGKSYGADQPTHKTDSGSAARFFYCAKASRKEREMGCEGMDKHDSNYREEYRPTAIDSGDKGQDTPYAGVNRSGGARNHHPTVKPLALMRYLCRLVTPPGGLILDPFMGSGTTLIAAGQEGFRAVGIEVSEEYCEIARKRIYGTLSMEEDR